MTGLRILGASLMLCYSFDRTLGHVPTGLPQVVRWRVPNKAPTRIEKKMSQAEKFPRRWSIIWAGMYEKTLTSADISAGKPLDVSPPLASELVSLSRVDQATTREETSNFRGAHADGCRGHELSLTSHWYHTPSCSEHPGGAIPILPGVTNGDIPPKCRLVVGIVSIPISGLVVNIPSSIRCVSVEPYVHRFHMEPPVAYQAFPSQYDQAPALVCCQKVAPTAV